MLRNLRNGAVLATTLEAAFDSSSRRKGLLGRDGLATGSATIIAPCSAIHTFFMRFTIDVIFASRDGRVVKIYPVLPPGRIGFALRAFAAIELPAGTVAAANVARGDILALCVEGEQTARA